MYYLRLTQLKCWICKNMQLMTPEITYFLDILCWFTTNYLVYKKTLMLVILKYLPQRNYAGSRTFRDLVASDIIYLFANIHLIPDKLLIKYEDPDNLLLCKISQQTLMS